MVSGETNIMGLHSSALNKRCVLRTLFVALSTAANWASMARGQDIYVPSKKIILRQASADAKKATRYLQKGDCIKAVKEYERLSEKDNPYAGIALANLYFDGIKCVNQDYSKALQLYLRTLWQADNAPMVGRRLGYMYEHGLGVPVDVKVALRYYKKADDKQAANAAADAELAKMEADDPTPTTAQVLAGALADGVNTVAQGRAQRAEIGRGRMPGQQADTSGTVGTAPGRSNSESIRITDLQFGPKSVSVDSPRSTAEQTSQPGVRVQVQFTAVGNIPMVWAMGCEGPINWSDVSGYSPARAGGGGHMPALSSGVPVTLSFGVLKQFPGGREAIKCGIGVYAASPSSTNDKRDFEIQVLPATPPPSANNK